MRTYITPDQWMLLVKTIATAQVFTPDGLVAAWMAEADVVISTGVETDRLAVGDLARMEEEIGGDSGRRRDDALLRMILVNIDGDATRLTRDQLVYKLEMVRDLIRARLLVPPEERPGTGAGGG